MISVRDIIDLVLAAAVVLLILRPPRGAGADGARLIRLEQKLDRVLDHLGIAQDHLGIAHDVPSDVPAAVTGIPSIVTTGIPDGGRATLPDGVRAMLLAGRKIEAIKLYRQATGVGLKDAKDAVERVEADLRGA